MGVQLGDKIGGYETTWHNVNARGGPIAGKTPYETVVVKDIEFVVVGQSGSLLKDAKTAESALKYCKHYFRPGIKVVPTNSDIPHFVIVNPSSDVDKVHQSILRAYSDGNGNPAYQDLDMVVDQFKKGIGERTSSNPPEKDKILPRD